MYKVTIESRNPSRDAERTYSEKADGYILITSKRNQNGTYAINAVRGGDVVPALETIVSEAFRRLEQGSKCGSSGMNVCMEVLL